ncbi:hypothetical protein [Lysinibacillus capsici]|uniref:hypothetical protein n=1 Tax=Lysinibacillus capsici TaxID=2115968 RepID=UPI0034E45145
MDIQYLYEFQCKEEECGHHFLAMNDTDDGVYCPYCGEYADYAPGRIYPVIKYTPGERKVDTDI